MSTAVIKVDERMPSVFDDFFKPWNELFDNNWIRSMHLPSVNITEEKNKFLVSLAAPGLKKEDFKIDVEGNMLTISSQKEESTEEKKKKFTRKEYNFSTFSRSFTLPAEINKDKIEANYNDGILKISLPRTAEAFAGTAKHIAVK